MEYRAYNKIEEIPLYDKGMDGKRAVYDLWRECFGDSASYTDFYYNWKLKDNQVFTVYKGDKIASMLHLNPYNLSIMGKKVPANYIVGVATREEDRRQGLMKLLLEKAMNQMNDDKMPFTYLMPAKEAIYLPFGFRIVYEQESFKQQIINTKEALVQEGDCGQRFEGISSLILEAGDYINLDRIVNFTNELLIHTYDVFVYRDRYYYERLIQEMHSSQGEVMLILNDNTILGYIAYMNENDLQVAEAVYLPNRKDEFWYEVTDKLSGFLSKDQSFHNPPTIMARIINLNSFLSGVTANKETSLIIHVEDEVIESNNGIFEVVFTSSGGTCIPSTRTPEIRGDISELTKLFFGQTIENLDLDMDDKENDIIYSKLNTINYYSKVFINDVV
jgi:predicted acetyltransferase